MTFTYSSTSITTNLAKVRLTIGDTDSDDQLLSDEEINYRLDQYQDDIASTAIACVKDILGRLARHTDRQGTGFSASRSQKYQQYKDLLGELTENSSSLCSPSLTGLSNDTREAVVDEEDFPQTTFTDNQHKNWITNDDDSWGND